MNHYPMKDKVVIVTGGSSGIGYACAGRFGSVGARLTISGRNAENLEKAARTLEGVGIEVLAVQADVSVEKDCVRLINETLNRYGRIDVLINNAGVSMRALFADIDLQVMRQLMETNFFGTVYCTKYALRQLIRHKGSVVGISSVAGYQGLPARTGYSASKFAMEGFLSALRVENSQNSLHVLIVNPGFTESNIRNTALMADGRQQGTSPRDEKSMMTSAEVADLIFEAVAKRRRRLVMSREGKLSYYLGKLFPEMVDRLVYKALLKEHDSPLKGK